MKHFLFILSLALFTSCSLVTTHSGSDSFKKTIDESVDEKKELTQRGVTPLSSIERTLNVDSEGPVTIINENQDEQASGKSIIDSLDAGRIKEASGLGFSTSEKNEFEAKFHEETESLKTWQSVSAIVIIAKAFFLLVLAAFIWRMRAEAKQWGFNPKKVGQAAAAGFDLAKQMLANLETRADKIADRIDQAEDGSKEHSQAKNEMKHLEMLHAKAEAELNTMTMKYKS